KIGLSARARTRRQIRPRLHRAANDRRLADVAVTRSHFVVARAERAGRAFAMNKERLFFSIDSMLFQLRGVVRDVVDHLHPEVFGAAAEYFGKNFANPMENNLAICE